MENFLKPLFFKPAVINGKIMTAGHLPKRKKQISILRTAVNFLSMHLQQKQGMHLTVIFPILHILCLIEQDQLKKLMVPVRVGIHGLPRTNVLHITGPMY